MTRVLLLPVCAPPRRAGDWNHGPRSPPPRPERPPPSPRNRHRPTAGDTRSPFAHVTCIYRAPRRAPKMRWIVDLHLCGVTACFRLTHEEHHPVTGVRGQRGPSGAPRRRSAHRPCSSIRRIRFRLRFWAVRRAVTYTANSSSVPRRRWQLRILTGAGPRHLLHQPRPVRRGDGTASRRPPRTPAVAGAVAQQVRPGVRRLPRGLLRGLPLHPAGRSRPGRRRLARPAPCPCRRGTIFM